MLSFWPLKFVLPPSPVPRQRYCECPRNLQIHVTVTSSIFCLLLASSVKPLEFVYRQRPVPRQRYCECPRNLQIHVTVTSSIFCLLLASSVKPLEFVYRQRAEAIFVHTTFM
jgi:hypothetical protein